MPQQAVETTPDLVERARASYQAGDVAASIAVHDKKSLHHTEDHGGSGSDYIKSIVFGGLDGIITTFAIVASVAGTTLPIQVVILTGFAKLLGDGLSMGIGDCMSEQAEQNHIRGELKREAWEMENYPEGEIEEMIAIYVEKGFSLEEASTIIHTMTKKPEYRQYFLHHMMIQELGQRVPDDDDNPMVDGGVTFASFMFFGSLPLWPYCIFLGTDYGNYNGMFGICIAVTVVCLFMLGALQAKIIRQNWVKQGLLMTLNGGLAAGASYLVGWGLEQAVGRGLC